MDKNRYNRKKHQQVIFIFLLIAVLLLAGCAYVKNRVSDTLDLIDIGFTFSSKPQFAFFYDFIPVVPIGYGGVQGYYIGIGGGNLHLWSPHYERSYGVILWGQEEVNFGTSYEDLMKMSDEERNDELNYQHSGLIGMALGPFPGPDYLISCPHYIHLGFIGAVGSPRYLQIVDFILGWTTLDFYFDDDDAGKTKDTKQPHESE